MVAQEDRPLGRFRDRRCLSQDLRDGEPVLSPNGHENARHQREVECHVAFVALLGFTEVVHHICRPLVGLRQQHAAGVLVVDDLAATPQELVRLREVLAVGVLALEQVRHSVEAEAVDAQVEPEPHHVDHRGRDFGVVVVEIGLMGEESMPIVLAANRIPGPVGDLGVDEDDPGVGVARVVVGPHVVVPVRTVGVGA